MHAIQRLKVILTLACAFADFFMQKIDRIRSEIAVGRSAIESTTISETVQCLGCEKSSN